jgi:type II secretory pathway pseudopilin PulG
MSIHQGAVVPERRPQARWYRILLAFAFLFFVAGGIVLAAPMRAHAGSPHPGGNIKSSVVFHVDVAQPSIVRILTPVNGSLHVQLCTNVAKNYSFSFYITGSGAFISSHGDILTADHVVNPPQGDLTLFALQNLATRIASDLQTSCNKSETPDQVFNELGTLYVNGSSSITATYQPFKSSIWYSTSFVGSYPDKGVLDTTMYPLQVKAESSFSKNDVAIAHADLQDTPSIKIGDSDAVSPTDNLTVLGFPGNGDLGDTLKDEHPNNFLTESINLLYVSAVKKNDNGGTLIQIGGNVEPGDSGGPALNANGEVVAVVSFSRSAATPDEVGQTHFLQATSSVLPLLSQANIDQTPGAFQTRWQQALTDFASNNNDHWHKAASDLQAINHDYPNFQGVQDYLAYAQNQAQSEKTGLNLFTNMDTTSLLGYGLIGLAIIVLVSTVLIVVLNNRRQARRQKEAVLATASSYLTMGSSMGAASPTPSPSSPYTSIPLPYTNAPTPSPSSPLPSGGASFDALPGMAPHYGQQVDNGRCTNGHVLLPNQSYCMQCGAPRA